MHLHLRPLDEADVADLRRIHLTPEVAQWWDRPDDDFPLAERDADGQCWHDSLMLVDQNAIILVG